MAEDDDRGAALHVAFGQEAPAGELELLHALEVGGRADDRDLSIATTVAVLAATGIAVRTAEIRRSRKRVSARVRSFGMPPTPSGMPPVVSLRPGAMITIELPRLAN
jgi:hypothetical protein